MGHTNTRRRHLTTAASTPAYVPRASGTFVRSVLVRAAALLRSVYLSGASNDNLSGAKTFPFPSPERLYIRSPSRLSSLRQTRLCSTTRTNLRRKKLKQKGKTMIEERRLVASLNDHHHHNKHSQQQQHHHHQQHYQLNHSSLAPSCAHRLAPNAGTDHLHLYNHSTTNRTMKTIRRGMLRLSNLVLVCALLMVAIIHSSHLPLGAQAASSARISGHHVEPHSNQYFLTEFCDLESKTLRGVKPVKQNPDWSLFMNTKMTASSVRIKNQKQQLPSSISFGPSAHQATPIYKQLNCTVNVQAPASHGLLVTVNSIGLPKNLTRLSIVLNKDSPHATQMNLEGETASANYLLTEPQSSKIAINLQSFQPIDWSHVSFDILFSVYKKGNSTGCPNKKWFDCGDNICVPASLVCDNNRNCPNGNDEMMFLHCFSPLFLSIAASLSLVLVLIIVSISVILVGRHRRLNKHHSFSNNVLAAEVDYISTHDNNSSKLDLTQPERGSYLAHNLFLGGFENPVWSNGTLTKQQASKYAAASTSAIVVAQSSIAPTATATTNTENPLDPSEAQNLVLHR